MYDITKMCYCCLAQTVNLTNIDISSSTNTELIQAFRSFGLDAYWLDTSRTILVCEKCSSKFFEFVLQWHENTKIVQGYLNLLNNKKEINATEAQRILKIEDTTIKLENSEEDDTAEYQEAANNIVTETAEKQCLIKREIKIEHESVEDLQSSLENTEMLIDQCHSELDIKEDILVDPEVSEQEEFYTNQQTEALATGEIALNDSNHTKIHVTAKNVHEKRHVVNQQKGKMSKSASIKKPFNCTQCSMRFRWKSVLDKHMRMHTGEQPFNCSICKKCFRTKHYLYCHMARHTGIGLFECARCPKTFILKTNLMVHMRTHTGERPYKCSVCDKCFIMKGNLNYHVQTHTVEKHFKCTICNKCFRSKIYLNHHLLVHTDKKPFECSICKKCFRRKAQLNDHVQGHTSGTVFKCKICNNVFKHKRNLNIHMRIHTDDKPFKCNTCKKDFNQKIQLINHVRLHTSE